MLRSGCVRIARLVLALAPSLTISPAEAADWYTGAPVPKAADEWIVSLDASTTASSTKSYFAYAGATAAVTGNLLTSGPRFRAEGVVGTYQYRSVIDTSIKGTQVQFAALAGYELVWLDAKLAGYLGVSALNISLSSPDPAHPATGTNVGVKAALDFYARTSERTMASAYGSISSNDRGYFTRLRAGYQVAGGLFLGPEAALMGNDSYALWRVGGHVTGMRMGPVQGSLALGYQQDRDQKTGVYGAADLRVQF